MADATEYLPVVIALAGAYGAYDNNRRIWLGCQTLFYALISLEALGADGDVNWGIAGGALSLTWLSYPSEKKWGKNVPKNAFHKVAGAMIILMGSFAMAANGAADAATYSLMGMDTTEEYMMYAHGVFMLTVMWVFNSGAYHNWKDE